MNSTLRQCEQMPGLTLCNPMNHGMPGLPDHHQLPESTQDHVHRLDDAIQPAHPLLSPSQCPTLCNPHGLFLFYLIILYFMVKIFLWPISYATNLLAAKVFTLKISEKL